MHATTFHLIRHASYGLLGQALGGRSPGHRLTEQGRRETGVLAEGLVSRPIAIVATSPLERTRETAEAIARRLGIEVVVEPGLIEIDFGEWTGMRFDHLHDKQDWQIFNQFRSTVAPPGGETMLAAQSRALDAVRRLRERSPGQEIVVVSHADIIKALLAHFLGVPLDLFQRLEIAPASRSVLRLFEADVRVDAVNLPPGA